MFGKEAGAAEEPPLYFGYTTNLTDSLPSTPPIFGILGRVDRFAIVPLGENVLEKT